MRAGAVASLRDHGAAMTYATAAAGGTGERVVRELRMPRGPASRSEPSERRGRWGGCGERTAPSRGQDPLRPGQDPLRSVTQDDRVNIE
jgi:hypothetical protein